MRRRKPTEDEKRRRERGINYNQTRLRGMAVIWMERDETATDSICVAHAHASKGQRGPQAKDYENTPASLFLGR